LAPKKAQSNPTTATNGRRFAKRVCETIGLRAKTTTNDARYAASGIVHRRGAGATSVVMYVVTATSCADGIAARSAQRSRRDHAMSLRGAGVVVSWARDASAHTTTSAPRSAKQARSTRACM